MAFSPISYVAPNYRDYKGWWLKAYVSSTTTPQIIALDALGVTTVTKLQLNKDGFITSSGGAVVMPYLEFSYDAYLFPTEVAADNNDTSDAIRVADNIATEEGDAFGINRVFFDTFENLQLASPTITGQVFMCQERSNARYILQLPEYVALIGDVTFSNGRIGALQRESGYFELLSFGAGLGDDDTSLIIAWLERGGNLSAGNGTYLVEEGGTDSGGAYVDLIKNVKVKCSPNAIFKAGEDLDNDLIRLEVPDGVLASTVTVEWEGGVFDQRLQKNSTSIPFSTNYPGVNQGASATTDGLSIIGVYDDNGTPKQGIDKSTISKVRFIASDGSWQTAGGDSGLNTASKVDVVYDCTFIGNRDLGVYHSSDSVNDAGLGLAESFKCHSNTFINCMFGVTSKRGSDNVNIFDNTFTDCMQCIAAEPFNRRSNNYTISNNTINGYIFGIDLSSCDGATISGNVISNAGVLLDDNSVPTVNFTNPEAIALKGAIDCIVSGNVIKDKLSEFSGNSCEGILLKPQTLGAVTANADENLVTGNIIKNIDVPFFASDLLDNTIEVNKVSGTNSDDWNMAARKLIQRREGELTIASGVISVNSSYHSVDTEADAASDDLDTINGGIDGQRLILKAHNSTRTVVLKDLTGNLQIKGDFSMTNQADFIELIYDESTSFWYKISQNDNQA